MKRCALVALVLLLLVAATPAVFAQAPGNLTTNLIFCYDFEEASGTRFDAWGSNDLTDNNTVGQTTGLVGNAAQFVAANGEYFNIASNANLQTGNIDFEIGTWVYLDSKGADRYILSRWSGAYEYILYYAAGADRFQWYVRKTDLSDAFVNANNLGSPSTATWYWIDAYHDQANDLIGIAGNGGSFNTAAAAGGINVTATDLKIGTFENPNYHDGRVDTTLFNKRLWTGAERTWLYNAGAGRSCTDVAGTAATATPTNTGTPTATPTSTPTPTPSPGPKVYTVELPEGGEAHVFFDLTAGDLFITVSLLAVLGVLAFRQLVELAWLNTKR